MRGILPVISVALLLSLPLSGRAQIRYSVPGSLYAQHFNTLLSEETGNGPLREWIQNETLPGWYAVRVVNLEYALLDLYRVDDGTDNSGGLYSYGSLDSSERALGAIASNTLGDFYYGMRFTNTTGRTLGRFVLSYRGEQRRAGGNSAAQTLTCYYYLNGEYHEIAGMRFSSPQTGGPLALDGNAAENSQTFAAMVTDLTWLPGDDLWLVWEDENDPGNDHGLAIENVEFRAYLKLPHATLRAKQSLPTPRPRN